MFRLLFWTWTSAAEGGEEPPASTLIFRVAWMRARGFR
jgi:hypothetical protein